MAVDGRCLPDSNIVWMTALLPAEVQNYPQSSVVDGVQDEALHTLISMRQRFTINSYQLAPNAVYEQR